MTLYHHYPVVNPRLGTGFAIFTSAYVALVLVLLILEQLGLQHFWIDQVMILLPMLFFLAIGLIVRTTNLEDFYVSGERVPALYGGLALTANIMGGVALASGLGILFFLGFDGLVLVSGWIGGLVLVAFVFAPYLRKAGAYTLPGYLGMRFGANGLRTLAALVALIIAALLLMAEIRIGAMVGAQFLPLSQPLLIYAGVAIVILGVVPGGVRSLTWMQSAQVIVILIGLLAPLIIVSLSLTNLPIPQLTYGAILKALPGLEAAKGIAPATPAPLLQTALPGTSLQALAKPFVQAFGALNRGEFILLALCLMIGAAALPAQITRLSTVPTIATARRSMGWAALVLGLVAITLPAYAAFMRYYAVHDLIGVPLAEIPSWAQIAADLGILHVTANSFDPSLGKATLTFSRDLSPLLLPIAGGLPHVFIGLIAAAILAAAMAAASAQVAAIGTILSNDLFYPFVRHGAPAARRLTVARLGMIATGGVVAWAAAGRIGAGGDPLHWLLWAFSLAGAAFFPVLALSIWWRRMSVAGAYAGLLAGALTAAALILMPDLAAGGLINGGLTAAVLGAPASAAAAILISLASPAPEEGLAAEIVDELRMPGGETLHARLLRLAGRGRAPRP